MIVVLVKHARLTRTRWVRGHADGMLIPKTITTTGIEEALQDMIQLFNLRCATLCCT